MTLSHNSIIVLTVLILLVVLGIPYWKERTEVRRIREENQRKLSHLIWIIDQEAEKAAHDSPLKIAQSHLRAIYPQVCAHACKWQNCQTCGQDPEFNPNKEN